MRNNKDSASIVIIGIIVVALVGLIGLAVFKNAKTPWIIAPSPIPTVIASTTVDTSTSSASFTVGWKTYRNEKYGFEFKYPAQWGNIKENDYNFFNNPNNREDVEFIDYYKENGIDLSRVSGYTFTINFDGKFCGDSANKDQCNLAMSVTEYSTSTPLKMWCYEGPCNTINIMDRREIIIKNSNFNVGGLKSKMQDEFFAPGEGYSRNLEVITPTIDLEMIASFEPGSFVDKNHLFRNASQGQDLFLEKLIDANEKIAAENYEEIPPIFTEYKIFLANLSNIAATIKFFEPTKTSSTSMSATKHPVANLTAYPQITLKGQASTLTWSCDNSTSAQIDNGIMSIQPCSGSCSGTKKATVADCISQYTLACIAGQGSNVTSANKTVTVKWPEMQCYDHPSTFIKNQ